jgi:hypothetical protein
MTKTPSNGKQVRGEQSQAAVEFVPGGLASDPVVAAPVSATLSVSPKRYADTGV